MKINPYACAHCQESFTTPSCLVIHVQNKHVKAEHSMENESNLIEHDLRTTVEGQSTYACSYQRKAFQLQTVYFQMQHSGYIQETPARTL